ncbi:hypothetical protein AHAS_Ahas18G0250500 [Arachis hypogaea]
MVESFGLENNDWIGKTYEKRAYWANAYLCDKFCAGVRTTSRCEGINSSLKKFIRSENCLLELLDNLDYVAKDYWNNEFMADFKCLYLEPVMTTGLESIEKAVSKVYMREIFFEVKKKIEWCKDAKSLVSVGVVPVANTEKAFQVRYGSLWSACMSMFFLAAQNGNMYENVLSQVEKLTKKIEPAGPQGGRNRFGREGDDHVNMLDPTIIKSNGAPRGSMNVKMGRRCRRCHGLGHDHRNCTARNKQPDDEVSV